MLAKQILTGYLMKHISKQSGFNHNKLNKCCLHGKITLMKLLQRRFLAVRKEYKSYLIKLEWYIGQFLLFLLNLTIVMSDIQKYFFHTWLHVDVVQASNKVNVVF